MNNATDPVLTIVAQGAQKEWRSPQISAGVFLVSHRSARSVMTKGCRRALRFTLRSGELLRVPRNRRHLRVLVGNARVSVAERDVVAPPGSTLQLPRTRHPALVSGLRGQSVLLDVW